MLDAMQNTVPEDAIEQKTMIRRSFTDGLFRYRSANGSMLFIVIMMLKCREMLAADTFSDGDDARQIPTEAARRAGDADCRPQNAQKVRRK